MNKQSTSDLPPLPEDTVEGKYAEESEEEDQTVQIQSLMKQMQDLLLTQRKKKEKRREKESYTPGASSSEHTLPRHVRPEDSPISPTPGPKQAQGENEDLKKFMTQLEESKNSIQISNGWGYQ
ncbi:hypothetical protein O181_077162 [Austropuccinia psidii MF-1]|uniref:Uncharacterized protein n=1 Tax=Austropuccinia psidii MF-1 TaxID=1389203 RepID=A0A9Q3IEF7_9BASI|nr:hypothetical protein [Austropuccinia psidii MF-1]